MMGAKLPAGRIIITIIAATIGWVVSSLAVNNLMDGTSSSRIDTALAQACSEVNRNCPMVLDACTTMDSAMAGPRGITYMFSVSKISDDDALKIKDVLQEKAGETLRLKKETTYRLDHDVTMIYCYRNAAGTVIFEFTIST
jgi:hypothetical protein